jgi:hypothetical protein
MIIKLILFAMVLIASPAFAEDTPECKAAIRETSRMFVEQAQAKHAYDAAKEEGKQDVMRERAAFAKSNAGALEAAAAKQDEFCTPTAINKDTYREYLRSMIGYIHGIARELEAP